MSVSYCLVNRSGKTIPSNSRLCNGILRWQQEVCKTIVSDSTGSNDSVPTIKAEWIDPLVAAVPFIFRSLSLSLSHLLSCALFNRVNFPIRFQ